MCVGGGGVKRALEREGSEGLRDLRVCVCVVWGEVEGGVHLCVWIREKGRDRVRYVMHAKLGCVLL